MKRFAAMGIVLALVLGGGASADMDSALTLFTEGNYEAALDDFLDHAGEGDPVAQTMAGYMYDFGLGVEADYESAAFWYAQAAVQGDSLAQYFLAGLYFDGLGVNQSYEDAAFWYRQSANQGDPDAQYYLALMYQTGDGVPQDDFEAADWMRLAAESGNADAQYEMGINYDFGYGVVQDFAAAAEWYLAAANQGHAGAQFELAFDYEIGAGVERDDAQAVFWYGQAVGQGHAYAQLALGKMYDEGRGVEQSYAEGARYFLMAAEQDVAEAQFQLAVDYEFGYGVPEDMAEAIYWYRRAAEQGHADAQFSMGLNYSIGDGVPPDPAAGAWWFLQAAMQGHELSQVSLGFMYSSGNGVPLDLVQSYMWMTLAAEHGGNEDAVAVLAELAVELSAAQIGRARELVLLFEEGEFEPTLPPPDPGLDLGPVVDGPGVTGQDVSRVQLALATLGYDPGPPDGLAGPQTRAAIRSFEQDYGLPVTGQVSDELNVALLVARAAESRRPTRGGFAAADLEIFSTGTGFVVSTDGHVVTNNHVIADCTELRVRSSSQQTVFAQLQAAEPDSDLALLQAPELRVVDTAPFRSGRGVRPGDDVVVIGYPLFGADMVTSSEAIVTTGAVSALAGPGEDRRIMQITAPVQPGNSGGPLLDAGGNVVGVVVAKLDALVVAEAIGDIPQNVNFAIQGWVSQVFLDSHAVDYRTAETVDDLAAADVAGRARAYTVLVECLR